jgi:hypothetical protein
LGNRIIQTSVANQRRRAGSLTDAFADFAGAREVLRIVGCDPADAEGAGHQRCERQVGVSRSEP